MTKLLLFFLCLIASNSYATTLVRVTPIAYTDQWYVLLGHSLHYNTWNDFKGRHFPCEQPWVTAQRILRSETCGFLDLNLASYPWCKKCNRFTGNQEIIYFVPIEHIDIFTLKLNATNNIKNDFIWVPAKQLMSIGCDEYLTLSYRGAPVDVSWGYVQLFQDMWPGFEKDYKSYPDWNLFNKYPDYPRIREASERITTNMCWYKIPGSISFYRKGIAYFEFTPNYSASFCLDGKVWPSVEHYMQAMRFAGRNDIQEHMRNLSSAQKAVELGVEMANSSVEYDSYSYTQQMMRATRAKIEQNPRLKTMLLCTSSDILVFDTSTATTEDEFWGGGKYGFGRNILGQILMQIRYEINHKCGIRSCFVEQPLACFMNGKYFTPKRLLAEHPIIK